MVGCSHILPIVEYESVGVIMDLLGLIEHNLLDWLIHDFSVWYEWLSIYCVNHHLIRPIDLVVKLATCHHWTYLRLAVVDLGIILA